MSAMEHSSQKETQQLIEAHKYARGLIESSLDALVTFDEDGIITDVNEQTVRLTGHTREELIGSRFRTYLTDPARALPSGSISPLFRIRKEKKWETDTAS